MRPSIKLRMLVSAVLVFLSLIQWGLGAETFAIDIQALGTADVRFTGLNVTADIEANVTIEGTISTPVDTQRLTAIGTVEGVAHRNGLTWIGQGWLLMAATGRTEEGDVLGLTSLLYASRQGLLLLQAGDSVEGIHQTVLQVGDRITVLRGTIHGSLAGGLTPATVPGTLRLSGDGAFVLSGTSLSNGHPCDPPATIPLADPNLPETFRSLLQQVLGCPELGEAIPD